jgi:hypothetical protein
MTNFLYKHLRINLYSVYWKGYSRIEYKIQFAFYSMLIKCGWYRPIEDSEFGEDSRIGAIVEYKKRYNLPSVYLATMLYNKFNEEK